MGYDCPRVQIISEVPGRRTIHATYRLWPWDEAWWAGAVVAAIEQVLDAFNFHLLVYVNDQGEADVVARHPPPARLPWPARQATRRPPRAARQTPQAPQATRPPDRNKASGSHGDPPPAPPVSAFAPRA